LKAFSEKYEIKVQIKSFFARVMNVQRKFQRYISRMNLKLELLKKYWEVEQHQMIIKLMKIKQKTKR